MADEATHCRACGVPLTRTFVDLGMSPLANSYIQMDARMRPRNSTVHAKICSCFLVQLESFERVAHLLRQLRVFLVLSDTWLSMRAPMPMTWWHALVWRGCAYREVASNDGYLLRWSSSVAARDRHRASGQLRRRAEALGVTTEVLFFVTGTARTLADDVARQT